MIFNPKIHQIFKKNLLISFIISIPTLKNQKKKPIISN